MPRPAGRGRRFERGPLQPAVGGVQPLHDRVQPVQLGVDHQRQAEVEVGLLLLEPGPLLHQLDQVAPVRLDDLVHVDAGQPDRDQDLDDQLVARRRAEVGRRAQPAGQLLGAVGGDPEPLLRAGIGVVVGLDEAVALQPLQGRVHLADVERPDLAGARLELLAQLQAVLRALAEQRQQRVPDAHDVTTLDIMPRIILGIQLPVQRPRRTGSGGQGRRGSIRRMPGVAWSSMPASAVGAASNASTSATSRSGRSTPAVTRASIPGYACAAIP